MPGSGGFGERVGERRPRGGVDETGVYLPGQGRPPFGVRKVLRGDPVPQAAHVLDLVLDGAVPVAIPPGGVADQLGESDLDRHVQAAGDGAGTGLPVGGSTGGDNAGGGVECLDRGQVVESFVDEDLGERPGRGGEPAREGGRPF